jgi:hypothetical protein
VCARSKLGGQSHGRSYFSSLELQDFHGPGLIWSGLLDFWYFFYNKSKRHHCREKSWTKTYRETHIQGYGFSQNYFYLKDFWAVSNRKARSQMIWAVKAGVHAWKTSLGTILIIGMSLLIFLLNTLCLAWTCSKSAVFSVVNLFIFNHH